jgi:hypothetical protein
MEIEFYRYDRKYFFQNKSNGDEGEIVMACGNRGNDSFMYVDYVELEPNSKSSNDAMIEFYEELFEKHLDTVFAAGVLNLQAEHDT